MRHVVLFILLAALPARATVSLPSESEFTGCRKYPADKRFKLSLRGEVGLADLVTVVSEIGCQSIILGSAVAGRGGKVNLEVPDLVTAPEVYRIFRSSLEVLGLTIERSGRLWKVVDSARAKEVSTLVEEGETPSGEQFVTRLLRLEHAAVAEVADVLGKLRSRDGDLTAYARSSAASGARGPG